MRIKLRGFHDLTEYQALAEGPGHAAQCSNDDWCPPEIFLVAAASNPPEGAEAVVVPALAAHMIAVRPGCTVSLKPL